MHPDAVIEIFHYYCHFMSQMYQKLVFFLKDD